MLQSKLRWLNLKEGLGIVARKPIAKELTNTRLLKEYASWVYCTECNSTVAYLCYVTCDRFSFDYTCKCGNVGHVFIEFENPDADDVETSNESLIVVKNRLCCPRDESPLFSVVEKNITHFGYNVVCNTCNSDYSDAS